MLFIPSKLYVKNSASEEVKKERQYQKYASLKSVRFIDNKCQSERLQSNLSYRDLLYRWGSNYQIPCTFLMQSSSSFQNTNCRSASCQTSQSVDIRFVSTVVAGCCLAF
uniref:Uncharacterized protein n=1 Tax=Arion vulgaris TaxID=1028688 RepID=A0A0B7AWE7_9EUPU